MKILPLLILIAFLSACTSLVDKPDPALLAEIQGPGAKSEQGLQAVDQAANQTANILELSAPLMAFIDTNIDRKQSDVRKLRALKDILFSPEKFNIQYHTGATKTAMETFRTRSGNCLSMTNLFIAMARYVDIDAKYHTVNVVPQWNQSQDTLILSRHINSVGRLSNGKHYVLDFLPYLETDKSTRGIVSDQHGLAIYYNNLGAEAIFTKEYDKAQAYLRRALQLAPEMADTWNNMGVAQRRLQRPNLAVASLKQAIRLDSNSYVAISNLSGVYHDRGEIEQAELLAKKVKWHRRRNPYFRYANAQLALKNNNYELALKELVSAIKLKNDDASFFFTLAKIYKHFGNKKGQMDSLHIAIKLQQEVKEENRSLKIES